MDTLDLGFYIAFILNIQMIRKYQGENFFFSKYYFNSDFGRTLPQETKIYNPSSDPEELYQIKKEHLTIYNRSYNKN